MQTERFTRISETQIPYELQVDATAIREQRAAASMREQGDGADTGPPIYPLIHCFNDIYFDAKFTVTPKVTPNHSRSPKFFRSTALI
jgi:hypothetical protein